MRRTPVSVKDAVLGLIVERRGYGYDLVKRFDARFGAAWRLSPSTVYVALDDLYDEGSVIAFDRNGEQPDGRPRRSMRLMYEATPGGEDRFSTWLTAPLGRVDAIRSEVFLKVGLATPAYALALLQVIDAQIDACTNALAELLATYELDAGGAREVSWAVAASYFNNDAGVGRLQCDLAWLRRVRAGVEALRTYGVVPTSMLTPAATLPPGWR